MDHKVRKDERRGKDAVNLFFRGERELKKKLISENEYFLYSNYFVANEKEWLLDAKKILLLEV